MNDEMNEQVETNLSNENQSHNVSQPSFVGAEDNGTKLPMEFLNDVPMRLTVELGMGKISLRELLQLGHGAVFELDKLAGEPLEVKVNDRLISRGEVVVVNDKYAIRLTDVINPEEHGS